MPGYASSPFQPDAVLPAQYASTVTRDDGSGPERRLMLAVLGDAAHCIQRYALARSEEGKMLFTEATEWFESTDSEWLFSFESICSNLGFAADEIRGTLPKGKPSPASYASAAPRIIPLHARRLGAY